MRRKRRRTYTGVGRRAYANASRTNALRRGQYLRALTAYADPPALLVGYYFRQGNTPRINRGKKKSFRMRLSEGKQILESKRLNEKEI